MLRSATFSRGRHAKNLSCNAYTASSESHRKSLVKRACTMSLAFGERSRFDAGERDPLRDEGTHGLPIRIAIEVSTEGSRLAPAGLILAAEGFRLCQERGGLT